MQMRIPGDGFNKKPPLLFFLSSLVWSLLLLSILPACNNDTKTIVSELDSSSKSVEAGTTTAAPISPDSVLVLFLKWYQTNEIKLNQGDLVKGGDQTNYSIDAANVKKYLQTLESSQYLSPVFLQRLRDHINETDKQLKKEPQREDLIPGFDADIVIDTQDPTEMYEHLNNYTIVEKKISGNNANVKLAFGKTYNVSSKLSLHNGGWLIDDIRSE